MTTNESWRRYLEAGAAVGQLTLARAEEIARGLIAPDEEERSTAWREFEELTRFGRLMGEQLVGVARAEVTKQLETFGVGSLDQLWERISDLVGSAPIEEPYGATTGPATGQPEDLVYRPAEPGAVIEHSREANTGNGAEHPEAKKDKKDKDKKDKGDKKAKTGSKGKKKKKRNKNKKDKAENDTNGSGPHWASGSNRVLSLAKPPDSAGTV